MIAANLEHISDLIQQLLQKVPREELADVVIFGSSAFTLQGKDLKRKVNDLDLFASVRAYERLKERAIEWEKKPGVFALDLGIPDVEVLKDIPGVMHTDVLGRAALTNGSQGLLVAALEDLVAWKRTKARPKDLADLKELGIDTPRLFRYLAGLTPIKIARIFTAKARGARRMSKTKVILL
jgi:hypothetical protein